MTDELETHATIRGSAQQLNEMIEQGSGDYHDDVLIRVVDDRVETLMQTDGRTVVSYCTFEQGYFDHVEGEVEAIMPVGGSGADNKGFLDYMQFAAKESGTIEISFLGDGTEGEHAPLASQWQAEGALNTSLRLPSSEDDLGTVPWDHPPRWTADDQYCSKTCLVDGVAPEDPEDQVVGPNVIETTAQIVNEQVIDPAEFADGPDIYPVSIEDGEFVLNVEGSQQDDAIWGKINAEKVEGPDIDREFQPGFAEVFGVMTGPVRLQTAPDGDGDVAPPLTVVQDHRSDRTVRHLISALADR